jgi:hypothetical protein
MHHKWNLFIKIIILYTNKRSNEKELKKKIPLVVIGFKLNIYLERG